MRLIATVAARRPSRSTTQSENPRASASMAWFSGKNSRFQRGKSGARARIDQRVHQRGAEAPPSPPLFNAEGEFADMGSVGVRDQLASGANLAVLLPSEGDAAVAGGRAGMHDDHEFRRVLEEAQAPVFFVQPQQMIGVTVGVAGRQAEEYGACSRPITSSLR